MDLTVLTQKLELSANSLLEKITSSVNRADAEKIGKVAAITLATYLVTSKLYDAFMGPLSGIPGPLALKFHEMHYVRNFENPPGSSWELMTGWREKYGDVVRLGPNRIMVSNKEMLRQILIQDDFHKGPMYMRIRRKSPPTLINQTDKDAHKQRRRVVSPAFSVKYLNSLETYMLDVTGNFIRRIDTDIEKTKNADGYGVVDIWALVQYLALDIIGETAFGQTFHTLEGNDHIVTRTITQHMKATIFLISHPIFTAIMMALPITGVLKANNDLKAFMTKIIMDRIEGGEKARRNDILQILIDTQHAANSEDRLTAEAIAQETVLFLVAGSETTSNTTGFAIIELLRKPEVLAALREEIDSVELPEGQKLFNHEQVKHLPYLNAVINETLRLDTIISGGLERQPDRDIMLGGRLFVPKGTILHYNFYQCHIDETYWPRAKEWIPERWLPGSDIPADTDAFFPFSAGTRNCIGKTFAMQEMRLSLANLVKFFDFKAIPAEMESAKERVAYVTMQVKSNSFKILMKRRTV
ncbi:cytochrome P450 [Fennellomyces sp. T-0311]|nr:cytochrome P450 [Fennellomyces sp. T-0311]